MASTHTDHSMALRQSIEVSSSRETAPALNNTKSVNTMAIDAQGKNDEAARMEVACEEDRDEKGATIKVSSKSKITSEIITSYLTKHIPNSYAPLGPASHGALHSPFKDPNSKFCYRHKPDTTCRKTADEPQMAELQRQLESFTNTDKSAITHMWILFSAAPAKQREIMLKGLLSICCTPQLSLVSSIIKPMIKIDYISALPTELATKILCFLDTTSLCRAAQVSHKWRQLADDDHVWHHMCEQHVNKKCHSCGWGLPLLKKQELRLYKRERQLRGVGRGRYEWSPELTPQPDTQNSADLTQAASLNESGKRCADHISPNITSSQELSKRQCTNGTNIPTLPRAANPRRSTVPWKYVYRDRYRISGNWKHGRFSTTLFKGHSNGIMAIQMLDDKYLATGSYDTTIKIWRIDTGKCIQTLTGHGSGIRALQFDGVKLISGSMDHTVKVWDWQKGNLIRTLEAHTDGVIAVHFVGNIVVSGSKDNTVHVWDFDKGTDYALVGHTEWINSVKMDVASRTIFSASDDTTIRMWDMDTKKTLKIFHGHVAPVQQLVLLPPEYDEPEGDDASADTPSTPPEELEDDEDDDYEYEPADVFADWPEDRPRPPRNFVSAGLDSAICVWSVDTSRVLRKYFGHIEGVWALAGDNLRIVSGAQDKQVKIWDVRSARCEKSITGPSAPVTCLGLSDSLIASGSEDWVARIYSFDDTENSPTPNARFPPQN